MVEADAVQGLESGWAGHRAADLFSQGKDLFRFEEGARFANG